MKKFMLAAVIAAFMAVAFLPGSAAAAPPNGGGYCGASANGCEAAANAGAQCGSGGGSGAFGAFGTYGYIHDYGVNYPGSNEAPGADGYQTGLNNSAVCGNRP